jgi:hypothetical protein
VKSRTEIKPTIRRRHKKSEEQPPTLPAAIPVRSAQRGVPTIQIDKFFVSFVGFVVNFHRP